MMSKLMSIKGSPATISLTPPQQLTWKCADPCRKTTFLLERAFLHFHVSWWGTQNTIWALDGWLPFAWFANRKALSKGAPGCKQPKATSHHCILKCCGCIRVPGSPFDFHLDRKGPSQLKWSQHRPCRYGCASGRDLPCLGWF